MNKNKRSAKDRIAEYQQQAANLELSYTKCPKCHGSSAGFTSHETRFRKLQIIEGNVIHAFLVTLFRWKCLFCKATFTDYPPFMTRYKRFANEDVVDFCQTYLMKHTATYRSISNPDACGIVYSREPEQDKRLSHSTLWSWLTFLGALKKPLQKMLRFVTEKDPSSQAHRLNWIIHPRKYRSKPRSSCLYTALHLIFVMPIYRNSIQGDLFP